MWRRGSASYEFAPIKSAQIVLSCNYYFPILQTEDELLMLKIIGGH